MAAPKLSIVIPVYNEEAVLPALFARLYPALGSARRALRGHFVNDGSGGPVAALLRGAVQSRPDSTRVILFGGNYGQHMAIVAGFEHCRGERVVTLDADLQNPRRKSRAPRQMDEGTTMWEACGTSARTRLPAQRFADDERGPRAHHPNSG